jgi:hypothetical protein
MTREQGKPVEQVDAEIIEHIKMRIAVDDVSSEWMIAWAAMRALPILKDIAVHLESINEAIAPITKGSTLAGAISLPLKEIVELLRKEALTKEGKR